MEAFKNYLQTLNLFGASETEETEDERRTNLIATRIYLILLTLLLVAIFVFAVSTQQTEILSIHDITQAQFQSTSGLVCPCSRASLSYGDFINISNIVHPICSSDVISQQWIESLYFDRRARNFLSMDLRFASYTQFKTLLDFCHLSSIIVQQNILKLESTPFIHADLLAESDLQSQVEGIFLRFQLTVPQTFKIQLNLMEGMLRNNMLVSATGADTYFVFSIYVGDNRVRVSNVFYIDASQIVCLCSNNPQCTASSGIYYTMDDPNLSYVPLILIPRFLSGCSRVYSTLMSSLECFFDQNCLDAIHSYSNASQHFTAMTSQQMSNQFNTSSLVEVLLSQLMTDRWQINISYDKYFSRCASTVCTYVNRQPRTVQTILSILISALGGLCTGLGILIPFVIRRIRRSPAAPSPVRPRMSSE